MIYCVFRLLGHILSHYGAHKLKLRCGFGGVLSITTKTQQTARSDIKQTFASNIRMLRKQKKLTQDEAGSVFGVTGRHWRRFETPSDSTLPDVELSMQIADYFGVTLNDLYDSTESQLLTPNELELIKSMRRSAKAKRLPMQFIAHALILKIEKLNDADRRAWIALGHRLADAREEIRGLKKKR